MSDRSERSTRLLEFFRAIWPTKGWYCIAVKTAAGMRQFFYATMEQAADAALKADDLGFDVYHACASFKKPGSRKASNVEAVKSFWMDVDVGEGKPYADAKLALDAVRHFVNAALLPMPSPVFSGSGWHLYWCLEREISPDEWKPKAAALKLRAHEFGFTVDPSRTGDVASILRPLGTHNHKQEPLKEVRWTGEVQFYGISTLEHGLGQTPQINVGDNDKFQVKSNSLSEPSYGRIIADRCAQLRNFRDRRGQLPEPEWYAGLCVLAHCADGGQLAHDWSSGDDRYDRAVTQRKLEHARADSGPTTCEHFAGLAPSACMGCPHAGKITSPIQLGRSAENKQSAGDGGTSANGSVIQRSSGDAAQIELPSLARPFAWSASSALTMYVPTEDDPTKFEPEVIYKAPLFASQLRYDEITEKHSMVLQHWLPATGWKEVLLPWEDHSPKAVMNHLGAYGINILPENQKRVMRYLHYSYDECQHQRKIAMEYRSFGWKGEFEGFLLGNEMYTPGHAPYIVGVSPELAVRAKEMKPYGTLENWRAVANSVFTIERQGLILLSGFASLLMPFVERNAGVIVAAVSEDTGKGKSFALQAAQSAWGTEFATGLSSADTGNARFKMISLLGSLPVTWDEMRNFDPEVIKAFVLAFSEGRDKHRLNRNSELQANFPSWSTILIGASNISLRELVSHDGETAQAARILECLFDEDLGKIRASEGEAKKRALFANRGQAGRAFVAALMKPGVIAWLQEAIPTFTREFEGSFGTFDTRFRKFNNTLACLKAAGMILNRAGILEFSVDRVMEYAARQVVLGKEGSLRAASGNVIAKFINDNWQGALIVAQAWRPKTSQMPSKVPQGKLVMRYEKEPARIFIDRACIKDWCRKNRVIFHQLAGRLEQAGLLVEQNRRINLGASTDYAAAGQVVCWEVKVPPEEPELVLPAGVTKEDNVVRLK